MIDQTTNTSCFTCQSFALAVQDGVDHCCFVHREEQSVVGMNLNVDNDCKMCVPWTVADKEHSDGAEEDGGAGQACLVLLQQNNEKN